MPGNNFNSFIASLELMVFPPPPLFAEQHYISGCRCLIIWLAAGPMLMNAVDPVNS